MRLRQICCHPGLVDPKYAKEDSAKMTALFYLLDQLREEGHKVLVFSQFVSMLEIIKNRLEAENRPLNYLTGQTKDRRGEIEKFQTTKDPSVFLLSLKAGGAGLNLLPPPTWSCMTRGGTRPWKARLLTVRTASARRTR